MTLETKAPAVPSEATEGTRIVRYSFASDATDERFSVERFEAHEELNRPFHITLDLISETDDVDSMPLLGRDAIVHLDRGRGYSRQFCGLVARVTLDVEGLARRTTRV